MPRISRFFGISIVMYFDDHSPPHFHAFYSGQEAQITIEGLELTRGTLQPRALALVREWASVHPDELRENWELARTGLPLKGFSLLSDMVRVKRAKHVREYVVEFTFTDDSVRQINLSEYLAGPVFEPLREIEAFKKFKVDRELGTIVWPNGADIDPDVLYLGLTPAWRESRVP